LRVFPIETNKTGNRKCHDLLIRLEQSGLNLAGREQIEGGSVRGNRCRKVWGTQKLLGQRWVTLSRGESCVSRL